MCATVHNTSDPNALPEWYDPFPKPNTIPDGWDLSEFLEQAKAAGYADEVTSEE